MKMRLPKTYRYLKQFEEILRTRSGYRRYFTEDNPFYSVFNVGEYTFAPYKVVWTRVGKDITGAVIGSAEVAGSPKPVVPAETAVLVASNEELEAHYFCAVLNSTPWRFVIVSTAVHGTGGFGSPNVLKKARIPGYNPDNPTHRTLAALSQQAHEATAQGDTARVQEIEAEIDALAAKVWGLAEAELREIRESLEELG